MASIGFIIKGISINIRELTLAVTSLRVEMMKDFVTKDEWQRMRDRVHDIGNNVSGLMAQDWINNDRRKQARE